MIQEWDRVVQEWDRVVQVWDRVVQEWDRVVQEWDRVVQELAIPLIKDTPPVDKLAICVPRDRNYAFHTVQQTLVHGSMWKITENVQRFTETRQIPRRTNELLINRGVTL